MNTEIDKSVEDSVVNLDDDRGFSSHDEVSVDETGSENDDSHVAGKNDVEQHDAVNYEFKRISNLTGQDIKGLHFGSEDHAFQFYLTYARCHSFVVRKEDITRNNEGKIIKRLFVCSREGLRNKKHLLRVDRKRDHRPITRYGCQARLRVYLDYQSSKWKVCSFKDTHNHELTPATNVHHIPKYCVMSDADKAQVDSLHSFGVRTCHIMGYLLAQKGGYSGIGFSKNDLYNHFHQKQQNIIKDGDIRVALSYLEGKAVNDPMFYSKFQTTDDGILKHLLWANGCSRSDLLCFGDVLAFDTTYKKNKYNNPLVIFSGSNHHSQTVIFGCTLLADETIETYKWVLKAFLDAMHNKQLTSVVTNGDGAMREAIKQIFPEATHRLCAWHLHKNACENVKKTKFLTDFKKAMYSNFSIAEFEEYWQKMIEKHGVVGNRWVGKTYDIRHMWAAAYLREKFFGRIRTTSQCEAINALIKVYVRRKSIITEFIYRFDLAVREYRNNEHIADFKDSFTEPVMTTSLYNFEREAAKIYTTTIFKEVKQELIVAGAFNVVERVQKGDKLFLKMNLCSDPKQQSNVVYDTVKSDFVCECHLFESRGIPCSHIFAVMKNEYLDSIPISLICKRWTRKAKTDIVCSDSLNEIDSDVMKTSRFGVVSAVAHKLCDIVAKRRDLFMKIRDDVINLGYKYEQIGNSRNNLYSVDNHVGDPNVVKTKWAPKKKGFVRKRRRCRNCNRVGHTSRRCPKLLENNHPRHNNMENDDDLIVAESPNISTTREESNGGFIALTN